MFRCSVFNRWVSKRCSVGVPETPKFPVSDAFSGSVRCSGVPKTPKFQISDFRLFLFGVRPTELDVSNYVMPDLNGDVDAKIVCT